MAFLLLALACTEGPTANARLGELRIVPAFAQGEDPSLLNVVVDSITVVARRLHEPAVVVDTLMPYAAGASLSWIVELLAGEDSLDVELSLSGQSMTLYEGGGSVIVPEATGEAGATHPVEVRYTGPVTPPTVIVTPATAIVRSLQDRVTFTAAAYRSNGSQIGDATFTWSSTNPAVATVDPMTGVVTPLADGDATIVASFGDTNGTALFTVAQSVTTIIVSPASATLAAVGRSLAFHAEARDALGAPLSGVHFSWSSSAPTVATVNDDGVATSVGVGAARLTASAGGTSASAGLTVREDGWSVVVTPVATTFGAIGAEASFSAHLLDANGQPNPGASFQWHSTNATVVSIDPVTGVATAVGPGTAQVVATTEEHTGIAKVTVAVGGSGSSVVLVNPSQATIVALGRTQTFSARAFDAYGHQIPRATFGWSSEHPSIATVSAMGTATAVAYGTTAIAASYNGSIGRAALWISPFVASLTVAPKNALLSAIGARQGFSAQATDGAGHVVTGAPTIWSSSNPAVLSIDPLTGIATATGVGYAVVVATSGRASDSAAVAVQQRVAAVDVTPVAPVLSGIGRTQQFGAVAKDANGYVVPSAPIIWSSSNPAIASIDASGVVTAVAPGSATIAAASAGVTGVSVLTVSLQPATVVITPSTAQFDALGSARTFTAVVRDSNGQIIPGATVTWSSANPAVATVDATGTVTAVRNGATTISANSSGVLGTASVTVAQVAASVAVSPTFVALGIHATQQFSATAFDANGHAIAGATFVWSSSQSQIATIDLGGLAVALDHGTTQITARAGNAAGGATLSVP